MRKSTTFLKTVVLFFVTILMVSSVKAGTVQFPAHFVDVLDSKNPKPAAGYTAHLLSPDGTVIDTKTTNSNGDAAFTAVIDSQTTPGYSVTISLGASIRYALSYTGNVPNPINITTK